MEAKTLIAFLLIVPLAGCETNSSTQNSVSGAGVRPMKDMASSHGDLAARLFVMGMSCPLCANNINKQLMRVPGVQEVSVDLGSGLVLARLVPSNPPTREQLVEAIRQSGFTLDRIEMPDRKEANND